MGKIRNVFIKQHQRGRWRYHWGLLQIIQHKFSLKFDAKFFPIDFILVIIRYALNN